MKEATVPEFQIKITYFVRNCLNKAFKLTVAIFYICIYNIRSLNNLYVNPDMFVQGEFNFL